MNINGRLKTVSGDIELDSGKRIGTSGNKHIVFYGSGTWYIGNVTEDNHLVNKKYVDALAGSINLVPQFHDPTEFERTYPRSLRSLSFNSQYGYRKLDSNGNIIDTTNSNNVEYGIIMTTSSIGSYDENDIEEYNHLFENLEFYQRNIDKGYIRVKAVLEFSGERVFTRTLTHLTMVPEGASKYLKLRWNNTSTPCNQDKLYHHSFIIENIRPTLDPIPLHEGYRGILKPSVLRDDDNQVKPRVGPVVNNTELWIYDYYDLLHDDDNYEDWRKVKGLFVPFGYLENKYGILKRGNYIDVKYLTNFDSIKFYYAGFGVSTVITEVENGGISVVEHNGIKGLKMKLKPRNNGDDQIYGNLESSPEFLGLIEVSVVMSREEYQRYVRDGSDPDACEYQFKPYDNL